MPANVYYIYIVIVLMVMHGIYLVFARTRQVAIIIVLVPGMMMGLVLLSFLGQSIDRSDDGDESAPQNLRDDAKNERNMEPLTTGRSATSGSRVPLILHVIRFFVRVRHPFNIYDLLSGAPHPRPLHAFQSSVSP